MQIISNLFFNQTNKLLSLSIEFLKLKKYYNSDLKMDQSQLIIEINRLKKEKNAIIMAHYYQMGDIQDIADKIGDSLALAQWAAKTEADIIVLCGVHFMGETAKILSPHKKVLVPDLDRKSVV